MVPIALGRGPGAGARASMAKVIIGGQMLSLILALLVTPVFYNLLDMWVNLTRRMVLAVTEQSELLERNAVLSNSIRLRNPYVDPMSLLQVELLRRKRSGESSEALDRAITATINGISAGLRNTG